ncbi:MAG: hypothetical protein WC884_02675 [Candidatus Paceibacterota bacterium]
MLSKKNIVLTVVAVLIVLGVGFWAKKANNDNVYSVVYLTTGEVYVGKLTTFPTMKLSNGYILATTKDATDPTKSNFQLQPISEALWAPQYLNINQKNVIFYGPLLSTSKIAETLKAQVK